MTELVKDKCVVVMADEVLSATQRRHRGRQGKDRCVPVPQTAFEIIIPVTRFARVRKHTVKPGQPLREPTTNRVQTRIELCERGCEEVQFRRSPKNTSAVL